MPFRLSTLYFGGFGLTLLYDPGMYFAGGQMPYWTSECDDGELCEHFSSSMWRLGSILCTAASKSHNCQALGSRAHFALPLLPTPSKTHINQRVIYKAAFWALNCWPLR